VTAPYIEVTSERDQLKKKKKSAKTPAGGDDDPRAAGPSSRGDEIVTAPKKRAKKDKKTKPDATATSDKSADKDVDLDDDIELDRPPVSMAKTQTTLEDVHMQTRCVIPEIRQWRSLLIHFAGYVPYLWNATLSELCPRLPSASYHAPQLERLAHVCPLNDDTKEFLLFGGHAPKLRDVTVHGMRLRRTAPLFEKLTPLEYNHHSSLSFVKQLQKSLLNV